MSQTTAGERTEKATPKKRRDARERGQVRKSNEVNTALSLLIMFGVWQVAGNGIISGIKDMTTYYLSGAVLTTSVTQSSSASYLSNAMINILTVLAPLLIAAFIIAMVVNIMQTGFLLSAKSMRPKMNRISPIQGFKRIFSSRSLMEMGKSILKTILLAVLAYGEISNNVELLSNVMGVSVADTLAILFSMMMNLAFKMSIALLIIAGFDFLYQWWKYEKDLKMTKQEVKDENKRIEGDPQIKGQIRQKQRMMGMARMMKNLEEADVVITNPTHFAVALSYKESKNVAPVVMAKGADFVALKIKEKAYELRIDVVENKPLARALYAHCEIGDVIPPEMYQAVAEVLAYLYRLKEQTNTGG